MDPIRKTLICLLLLSGAAPAVAAAEAYRLDPVHTRVVFLVEHAGFSQAMGTFSGITGELDFDPADWSAARVEVQVPLDRLDLGDAGWREKILSRPFFDAARHPVARFRSTRVEATAADRLRIVGVLALRGVERELVLEARLNKLARHPLTFRRTAGFSASAELRRSDFGLAAWPNVVGDRVRLLIEAEAVRYRPDPTPPAAKEPDHADPQPR